jgi:hypothetical protein
VTRLRSARAWRAVIRRSPFMAGSWTIHGRDETYPARRSARKVADARIGVLPDPFGQKERDSCPAIDSHDRIRSG